MSRRIWVGVDAGKAFHWAVVLGAEGEVLLSRRVENDEEDLSALLDEVLCFGLDVLWATDQPGGSAALLLALLWERGQRVLYVPGIAVDRARDAHRGESKTDARDARLIAELARVRRDLAALEPGEELLAELKLLVGHRRDLVLDQARAVVRLRDALLALFPGLERVLGLRTRGPLVLVSRYQTPPPSARRGASGSRPTSSAAGSGTLRSSPSRRFRPPRRSTRRRPESEWRPRSSASWPRGHSTSRSERPGSTGSWKGASSRTPWQRSCSVSPAWAPSLALSS
jgi:Transposase